MRFTGVLKPTEPYPRVQYYITAKPPMTDEEKEIVYTKHLNNVIHKLSQSWRSASPEKLLEMAKPKAENLLKEEIERNTNFKKVVFNTFAEEQELRPIIQSQENFIEWD
jgi:hypothetical protein